MHYRPGRAILYSIARALSVISWIATILTVFCTDSVHKSTLVHRFLWKTCINRWISVRLPEKGVNMRPAGIQPFRIISQNTAHPPKSPPICAKLSTFASSMPSPIAETASISMVE